MIVTTVYTVEGPRADQQLFSVEDPAQDPGGGAHADQQQHEGHAAAARRAQPPPLPTSNLAVSLDPTITALAAVAVIVVVAAVVGGPAAGGAAELGAAAAGAAPGPPLGGRGGVGLVVLVGGVHAHRCHTLVLSHTNNNIVTHCHCHTGNIVMVEL